MKFTTKAWAQTQFQNFANKIASVFAKKTDIPTVGNGTLTIQKNGTNVQTFTANQSGNVTANITVPTNAADVGAVATANVMTTPEQINANTNPLNPAGATAVKAMVGQINSNLLAVGVEYELKNGWSWTSGTGIARIGNTVTICLALIGTETEFYEHDKLMQFDVKYAPNTWTQIPASAESMDGTLKPILLRVDSENGGIVAAIPFKAHHIMINASWIARL